MTSVTAASVGSASPSVATSTRPGRSSGGASLDPEQLVRHWPPAGATVPFASVTIEPWLGGRFENTMVDEDGAEVPDVVHVPRRRRARAVHLLRAGSGIVSTTFLTELGPDRTPGGRAPGQRLRALPQPRSPGRLPHQLDRLAAHLAALVAAGSGRLGRPAGSRRGGEAALRSEGWGVRPGPGADGWRRRGGRRRLDHGPVDEQVAHARRAGRRSGARRRPGSRRTRRSGPGATVSGSNTTTSAGAPAREHAAAGEAEQLGLHLGQLVDGLLER